MTESLEETRCVGMTAEAARLSRAESSLSMEDLSSCTGQSTILSLHSQLG